MYVTIDVLRGIPLIPLVHIYNQVVMEVLRTMKTKEKKSAENKSIMIGFRLTNEEYSKFASVIEETGVSKSEFFRLVITGKFDPNVHGKVKKNNYRELLRLFNKSSNNINQIAKKINMEYRNGFISENTYLRYLNVLVNIRDSFVTGIEKC